MRILIGAFLIYDESDAATSFYDPQDELRTVVDPVEYVRAPATVFLPRALVSSDWSFTITRAWATYEEAGFEQKRQPLLCPRSGLLQLEGVKAAGGKRVMYLDAVLQGISSELHGVRTNHTYRFTGGAWRTTPSL